MKNSRLIVGLDVGSTKIRVLVGEAGEEGVDIIGVGVSDSKGLKKGVVVNIESTAASIREAVKEAETMVGIEIKAAYVGITGGHIESFSSRGVIAVKEKEITQMEVNNVIDAAKAVAIPFDREMLHVVPAGFVVNGENGISDPCGMTGVRLETDVRIITGAVTSVQNLIRSCQKAGLKAIDVVFQPLASAEAILTLDEKKFGVAVIDIGGGTTDIVLFHEGNIYHTAVLALGGNNFTNDIAIGLRTPAPEAEMIKKRHGCSMLSMVKEVEEIEIEYTGGRPIKKIPRHYLIEILQPRAEELFGLIREEITGKGFHKLMTCGVVLTGGSVLMGGMDIMAENMLELPVRVGNPRSIGGITDVICNTVYATGVGLVLYGAKETLTEQSSNNGNILNGMMAKAKGWMKKFTIGE